MTPPAKKWSKWIGSLVLGISGTFAIKLQGEINGTNSIEWIVCESAVVATGQISEVKKVPGPEDLRYTQYDDCVFTVDETIKGEPKPQITFRISRHPEAHKSWMRPGRQLLVLLRLVKDNRTDHEHLFPTHGRAPLTIIDLSELPGTLYDKEIKRVTDRDALLALCRTWAKSDVKHSIHEAVPFESELHEKLYAGSSVFIKVPAEEKHRLKFLAFAKSTDSRERGIAAGTLWMFPGPESEAALRSLLADTTEAIWQRSNDSIAKIECSVRSAACRSLKELGKPVPELVLEREPTAEERRKFRHEAWQRTFKWTLQDGWELTGIRDSEARVVDSNQFVVVEVDLTNGDEQCTLVLVPIEFGSDKAPAGIYLGMDELGGRDKRRIYAPHGISPALRDRLSNSFGLGRSTKQ